MAAVGGVRRAPGQDRGERRNEPRDRQGLVMKENVRPDDGTRFAAIG